MQTKNIKADGETVYAYAKEYEWNPRRRSMRSASPVVVTATGQARRTQSSWGYRGAGDGVMIRFLDGNLKRTERTAVVRPAEIRELWETYKPAADEEAKTRRESLNAALTQQQDTAVRLDAIFERLPKGARRPWWATGTGIHNDKSMTTKGEMYRTELAELLETAYEAGVKFGAAHSDSI